MLEANLWIGRPGCLESFDAFAQEFMKAEPTGRSDVVKRGEAVVATLETTADKNSATVYLKVMEKVLATGDEYITKETARVNKLLEGKLSDEKKNIDAPEAQRPRILYSATTSRNGQRRAMNGGNSLKETLKRRSDNDFARLL